MDILIIISLLLLLLNSEKMNCHNAKMERGKD